VPVDVVNPISKLSVETGLFNGESPETVAPILTVAIGLALR
jgi:Tfp pilus assembly PilM family ATPase